MCCKILIIHVIINIIHNVPKVNITLTYNIYRWIKQCIVFLIHFTTSFSVFNPKMSLRCFESASLIIRSAGFLLSVWTYLNYSYKMCHKGGKESKLATKEEMFNFLCCFKHSQPVQLSLWGCTKQRQIEHTFSSAYCLRNWI